MSKTHVSTFLFETATNSNSEICTRDGALRWGEFKREGLANGTEEREQREREGLLPQHPPLFLPVDIVNAILLISVLFVCRGGGKEDVGEHESNENPQNDSHRLLHPSNFLPKNDPEFIGRAEIARPRDSPQRRQQQLLDHGWRIGERKKGRGRGGERERAGFLDPHANLFLDTARSDAPLHTSPFFLPFPLTVNLSVPLLPHVLPALT
eukprot:2502802-Rhodomonas_salina.1